ncbi:hypothetical protein [Bacillus mycoides]|uniref:Uncharacterized protein n=1 Tax=Bacillus mycoides (strain KBAB4) TaxID=315730 RepID=A9VVI9_BACMK|nr:hypothetical protein [Bacillus mycoides]ABY46804.1 hypothetical protein BcerKBAB4_5310 [Bacillus mycoides KBAB4]
MDLIITNHSVEEMRNEILKDEQFEDTTTGTLSIPKVKRIMREYMDKATPLGEIVATNGKVDRLFAHRRYCFILERDNDVLITVYRRDMASAEVREMLRPFLLDKLREYEEKESTLKERLMTKDLEYTIEKAVGESSGIKRPARVEFLRRRFEEAKAELLSFQVEKSKIVKGIALYI